MRAFFVFEALGSDKKIIVMEYSLYIIVAMASLAVGALIAATVMKKNLLKKSQAILEEAKEKAE
ncbi:MAG: hypothetical protein DRJ09_05535, partial [Bacteroidetes bacterium]